jgi:hypothetical protein
MKYVNSGVQSVNSAVPVRPVTGQWRAAAEAVPCRFHQAQPPELPMQRPSSSSSSITRYGSDTDGAFSPFPVQREHNSPDISSVQVATRPSHACPGCSDRPARQPEWRRLRLAGPSPGRTQSAGKRRGQFSSFQPDAIEWAPAAEKGSI